MSIFVVPGRKDVESHLASGNVRQALVSSAALLVTEPANVDYLSLRAAALLAAGTPEVAVDVLAGPASVPTASPALIAALAICQVNAGERRAALSNFQRALVALPDDTSLRLTYAECLDELGDSAAALPEYLRAVHTAQRQGRWRNDATTPPLLRARVQRAMDRIDAGKAALFDDLLAPHIAIHGRDAMARVREAVATYLDPHLGRPVDARQKPTFLWMPGLASVPFFKPTQFAWYEALESAATSIEEELHRVLEQPQGMVPFLTLDDPHADNEYLDGDPLSRSWNAFFFYRHGERLPEHHAACPATSFAIDAVPIARINAHAPEVLFSVLAPRTHIKPHHGVTNTRVVTHLPLIIPDGDCKLVVGGIEHGWERGRCITFDDTFLHEAWNRTDHVRVVLILDTWHPDLRPEECSALKDLIERIGEFNVMAGIR